MTLVIKLSMIRAYKFIMSDVSKIILQRGPGEAAGVKESLVCGGLSGICGKAVIYPLDMVKKRLQVC